MDRIKVEHISDMARTIGDYYDNHFDQDGRRYTLLSRYL